MSNARKSTQVRAKLVCGVCGRVLDRLVYFMGKSRPISEWALRVEADGTTSSVEKPSIRRSNTAIYDIHGDVPRTGQQRYECHRRCGAVHVVRVERITAAMQAGQDRIIVGVDV